MVSQQCIATSVPTLGKKQTVNLSNQEITAIDGQKVDNGSVCWLSYRWFSPSATHPQKDLKWAFLYSHSNCHLCMKSVPKSQLYYLHTTAIFPMALNYWNVEFETKCSSSLNSVLKQPTATLWFKRSVTVQWSYKDNSMSATVWSNRVV